MANTGTVTRKLQGMGFPMTLIRGKGCFYFVLTHKETMQTWTINVSRFHSFTEKEWMEIGKRFSHKYFITMNHRLSSKGEG